MRVEKLSVFNFKSLISMTEIDLSSGLDVFIGQNDCGKSTILQALDMFFDPAGNCELDPENPKNDLSFHARTHPLIGGQAVESDEVAIMCTLSVNEEDLAQKESELATLAKNGHLTILKKCSREPRFKAGKGTAKKEGYFVLSERFSNNDFNDLTLLKEKELIALMEKYPDSSALLENANEAGKPKIPERVSALVKLARNMDKTDAVFAPFAFPTKGPDPIWPQFRLIDTKTALDGKHKIIDDAFKKIDAEIEKSFAAELTKIQTDAQTRYSKITGRIKDYAQKHYITQLEYFQAIPAVRLSVGRDLVLKRVGQKEPSHFDQQGDGTKRRMMVAILQVSATVLYEIAAEETQDGAEESVKTEKASPVVYEPLKIWAFDEPELHLHPGAQRDLFNSLSKFKEDGFQVVCSTHSTVFVNSSEIQSVHLIALDPELYSTRVEKDPAMADLIKKSVGLRNSDVFFSNVFAIVEGATETGALPFLFENRFGSPIHSHGVSLIDGKGCSKAPDKVDFLLSNLGNVVCLFDTDAKAGLGIKATELEGSNSVTFIGTADFEDSFDDEVWLRLLTESFSLKDPADESEHWTQGKIAELRADISLTNANKKFLRLIESSYKKRLRELDLEGDGTHPYNFDKVEIGKRLAEISIELDSVPLKIISFLDQVKTKLT